MNGQKMASNRFYIPNADEFFEARLLSLLQQCRDCLHENSDGGHAEFLARRLEEYQRTLRVIYGRVRESDQENQLTQDLERLMQVIGTRFQSLATLYSDIYYQSMQYRTVQYFGEFTAICSGKVRQRWEAEI